jgi:hypothetical protein
LRTGGISDGKGGITGIPLPPILPPAQRLPGEPSTVDCNGACPEAMDRDRFLCVACGVKLDRRRGLIRSFMNKYAVDRYYYILLYVTPLSDFVLMSLMW